LADSGYQGLQKEHKNISLPIKKSKNKKLSSKDKAHNQALSSLRVLVENKICNLKVFRIVRDQFRNRRYSHALIMQIIAGIVNLKAGF
jgi:hypothetical protein